MLVLLSYFNDLAESLLRASNEFYRQSKERPGQLQVTMGMKNALGVMMYDDKAGKKSNAAFPDLEHRIDRVFDVDEIMDDHDSVIESLFGDIAFAFNARAVLA